jgi:DNA-binding protein H-NS
MTDIKANLEQLKQQLEQHFETETPERQAAREKALKRLEAGIKEFEKLSQKIGITPDQMTVVSQLQDLIFRLGNVKGR